MIDRYYVGSTQDIDLRIERHNSGTTRSTKAGVPWCQFASVPPALDSGLQTKLSHKVIFFFHNIPQLHC